MIIGSQGGKELYYRCTDHFLFLRFNRRYEPEFNHIRRILSQGILGRITMIKLYRHPVYCRRRDWQTLNRFCGGMLNNWGPHILDQALQLLGSPVVDVWSDLQHNFSAGDADDQIKILLKAANGCVADIEISSACALPGNLYEVWGDRGALTVPNEGKVLRLKYLKPGFQLPEIHAEEGNYPLFYGNQEHLELISEEIPVEAGRGHTLQKGARKESGVGTQATGYYSQDTMWLDVYDAIRNGYYGPHNPHPGVLPEAFDNLTDKEIQDGAIYLPIPETAFNNNDLMLQNIYWQSKMR